MGLFSRKKETPDEINARVRGLMQKGEIAKATQEIHKARKQYPETLFKEEQQPVQNERKAPMPEQQKRSVSLEDEHLKKMIEEGKAELERKRQAEIEQQEQKRRYEQEPERKRIKQEQAKVRQQIEDLSPQDKQAFEVAKRKTGGCPTCGDKSWGYGMFGSCHHCGYINRAPRTYDKGGGTR